MKHVVELNQFVEDDLLLRKQLLSLNHDPFLKESLKFYQRILRREFDDYVDENLGDKYGNMNGELNFLKNSSDEGIKTNCDKVHTKLIWFLNTNPLGLGEIIQEDECNGVLHKEF